MAEKKDKEAPKLPPGFEEIGDHWEQMAEFKNKNDFIQGKLLEVAGEIGPNKSMVYILDVKGVRTGVWGSTILDRRMKFVEQGDEILIVYQGKAHNDSTGRDFHDFKVMRKA